MLPLVAHLVVLQLVQLAPARGLMGKRVQRRLKAGQACVKRQAHRRWRLAEGSEYIMSVTQPPQCRRVRCTHALRPLTAGIDMSDDHVA